MRQEEFTRQKPNGRRWHAWTPFYEVTDKYGKDDELIESIERRTYTTKWPSQRDILHILIGALAFLILQTLRTMPH